MCQERGGRNSCTSAISTHLIHAWYMKHAFQAFRSNWRCISFAKMRSKKNPAYQAQADMAKTMNLQRASARAVSSRSNLKLPALGCGESSQWMFRSLNSFYMKRKGRHKDHRVHKLKSLARSSSLDGAEDPISSSSLTELIASCTVDFDLRNIAMSPDSEYHTTGEPPTRRSSDAFLSPKNCDSSSVVSGPPCPNSSPFRSGRSHRRKRSLFRAAKVALTGGGRGNNAAGVRRHILPVFPLSSGIGIGRSRYSLSSTSMKTRSTRMVEKQHPTSPAQAAFQKINLSRGTSMTMDTSSSPCKSSTNTTWMENYDMLTETVSTSSWSLRTDLDSPPRAPKLDSPGELDSPQERYAESPQERNRESPQELYHESPRELYLESPGERELESPHEGKLSSEQWSQILQDDDTEDFWFDDCKKSSSRAPRPFSRSDIELRQKSAIEGVRYTGKDFQEAIVDIILDNDVNDLVDLEEFLQNYFRLNSLYQGIIQQFFNDLSDDLVHPKLSRAPSVFARLAAGNKKSVAGGKRRGSRSRELL